MLLSPTKAGNSDEWKPIDRTRPGFRRRYGVALHIHACATGSGTVILDVRRDKYLGLGREESELLADAVTGWPIPPWLRNGRQEGPASPGDAKELCESLVGAGVLERISETQATRVVAPPRDMRGEWISVGDELEVRGEVTARHLSNFLASYGWARYSLAWRPFFNVVNEVKAGKRRGARGVEACDIRRLAAMVDVFRRLRPFVFAAEGRCLLHALTLMSFLSKYQLHPEWVIGVTTQPWGAHSWVQWRNFLLDSNPEKVCGYTPILVV